MEIEPQIQIIIQIIQITGLGDNIDSVTFVILQDK